MTFATTADPRWSDLRNRWSALKGAEPLLRARDAAERLGVSEGELLAARCGEGVVRLDRRWKELLQALPKLGRVMALTRNEQAVHEKVGQYDKITVAGKMGLALAEDIDLRIFLGHWHFAFAAAEETRSGLRHSLQIFDRDGTAVHKIYLREESNHEAYQALLAAHRNEDQRPGIEVEALPIRQADKLDSSVDQAALRARWLALKDVHDFRDLLIDLGVGREQSFRLVGRDYAYPVARDSFRRALEIATAQALPIMVFVGSPGVIQIHSGPVNTLKELGPWFNVLDPGFNLHLRQNLIAAAWVVKKPTSDGTVTSLEILDSERQTVAMMFGKRKPGEAELEGWRILVDSLERTSEA
ncbi:MAG: hemin-degrading factor [Kiloniellales bacterium]